MGANVSVYAVLGAKINKNKLYKSRRTRGCSHRETYNYGKFCQQCGKPMWEGGRRIRRRVQRSE